MTDIARGPIPFYVVAALAAGCSEALPSRAEPDLTGSWVVTWMEGYVTESLEIRPREAISREFTLRFTLFSDVGGPLQEERTALFVDGALLLDRAREFGGRGFAALALEEEGGELVLVPYPNPPSLMDVGDVRAVFRRESTHPGR